LYSRPQQAGFSKISVFPLDSFTSRTLNNSKTMETGVPIKALVNRLKQSDEAAFRLLYDYHKSKLYGYCFKFTRCGETAKEIVHDVFVKLWEEREQLNADLNITAFLFTIAKHKLINHIKQGVRNAAHVQAQLRSSSEASSSTEQGIEYGNYLELAHQAITRLPPQRQLIFNMSRQQELSHQEIALQLGISKNTVKEQIAQALKYLRLFLDVKSNALLILAGLLFL
jgi:RNA polymerase sigma-70 factor (family 1)